MTDVHPYRIFVSYSHEDRGKVEKIVGHLKGLGLKPMWDRSLLPGASFTDQIKDGISFAHLFIPLITKASLKRPWVHQEIGYAMGVQVPVMPLAIGEDPEGIIQQLHALVISPTLGNLKKQLTLDIIEFAISTCQAGEHSIFESAHLPEERTAMLADYANKVMMLGGKGRIRQYGAFSLFCIPNEPTQHPIWRRREGRARRSDYYHKLQRMERVALEAHARECGCDLIIYPYLELTKNGPGAKKARLETLLEFLESMKNGDINVAVKKKVMGENLLIVGDWFLAESVKPKAARGYYHTMLTRHAPTVVDRVRQYELDFKLVLKENKVSAKGSRAHAVTEIKQIINSIK